MTKRDVSRKRRVLVVGDHEFREFAAALEDLSRHAAIETVGGIDEAAERLRIADATAPAAIVLAQARPGRFRATHVERLHGLAPLARLAALLGTWCEGEGRSGRPWPGVARLYWHQWTPRTAFDLLGAPDDSPWSLPRTATDNERLWFDLRRLSRTRRGLLGVDTRGAASYHALSDALHGLGYRTRWMRWRAEADAERPILLLWEGDVRNADDLARLDRRSSAVAPARTVALLNFPRWEDRQRAREAGAAAVVSKPFPLIDLDSVIADLLSPARTIEAA